MDATPISSTSGVPPYRQLAADLRRRIDAGELTGRLPTEVALAEEYQVAKGTLRKALALLREQGVIVTAPGWGSSTVPPEERPEG